MRINVWVVVLLTSLVAATYGFGIYLFAQLVPDMQASLGFSFSSVGVITAAGQLGFLLCALLAAWLTLRVGGGWVILGSGLVCAAALLVIPQANNIVLIGVLLTVLAGTAATVYVPMVEVVAKVVAYRYRGMAMGLVSSGTSYGVFVNSLLVPLYAPQGAWHVVWWWVGGIALGLSVLVFFVFTRAGLLSQAAQPGAGPLPSEAVAPPVSPVALKQLLMTPWVLLICSMNFLIGMATFPFQNYLSSYLRTELGFDVAYTAQIWATIGFVGMFAGLAVGWLSDKLGLRPVMFLVYVCVAASALILLLHPLGYWPLLAAVLFAAAFYPIFGLIPAYVSKLAASAASAVAIFAVANVMQGGGGMLGNYAAGLLASRSGSFAGVYSAIALLALVLMVLTLKLPSPGGDHSARNR